jgi:hypothetical protein
MIAYTSGCSLYNSLEDISRLKFKIDSVSDLYIAGVSVSSKSSLAEFTSSDLLKISFAFMSGNLPATFNLNLEVMNPNFSPGRDEGLAITIKSFPWELFIDNKEIIKGNITEPVVIPSNIQKTLLPVNITMNLVEIFQDKKMNEITELMLKFSSDEKSISEIQLYARPVLDTFLGEITYPEKLKIVAYIYN